MTLQYGKAPVHPGTHIRESIIPPNVSVTKAAELLDIGRPALSNLLNGNAALSPEMAVRIEKAFQADASVLLELQTQYDEHQARAKEDNIAVRAYSPPFLDITALQISAWADSLRAREQLPALLRMLVHSTGSDLSAVDFPAFDNSQRKGWDGQVVSGKATPWIPHGQSGWEFGCSKDSGKKAKADYQTRTRSTSAKERKSKTFVFVTPRNWAGKSSWLKEMRERREWKDVLAYDASDLEQWLEQSIPAQTRIREFQGNGVHEITTLRHIWDEWVGVTEIEIPRELFTPAVEQGRKRIEGWLKERPAVPFVVTADSTLEALAFLNCALDELEDSCIGAFERAVVIRSLEAFQKIPKTSSNFIAIVASSDVEKVLAGFQKKSHTIIVRGRNTVRGGSIGGADTSIELGPLGYTSFREALRNSGLDDSRIDQLARESGRSPTILRRRLAQVEAVKTPHWANNDKTAQSLIPFILVGDWDSSVEDDKEILRYIAKSEYEEIEQRISQLQSLEESPVWSIGHRRGVVSKIDALYAAHWAITEEDLKNFLFVAEIVLSEQDPALELAEEQRWAANLYGKSRKHSNALRRSICDTLVLLAVHGNPLVGDRLGMDIENHVSHVVGNLLNPPHASTWLSQKDDLPQYAEAAPDTFLDIIEADLRSETPQIKALLTPTDLGIFGGCSRSGLLWALELLAWKPERLVRIAFILARLCAWKIDDNWTNKPSGSLESIFRCWMPQTAASVDERNRALETLTKRFPDVGWQICVGQFSPGTSIGHYSNKPHWRTDAQEVGEVITRREMYFGQIKAIELALDWCNHDEHTLGDLVERLDVLSPEYRKRVWDAILSWNGTEPIDSQKASLRERIRMHALIRRNRNREIDDVERECVLRAYEFLEPQIATARHQWLFMSEWVHESADELEDEDLDLENRQKRIEQQRHDALLKIQHEAGMDGVKELLRAGNASHAVGRHMAEVCSEIQQSAVFVQSLMDEQTDELRQKCELCISGFLEKLKLNDRNNLIVELLPRIGSDASARIRLLCCAPFDSGTWQHMNGFSKRFKQLYWKSVFPSWGRHDANDAATFVDELIKVRRPRAAFHAAHMNWKVLESPRLIRLLTEVATSEAEPPGQFPIQPHYVSSALKLIEQRGDALKDELARMELLYIDVLEQTEHGISILEENIAENPALFIQALALAFRRNDGGEDPQEWRSTNSSKQVGAALSAHTLLNKASRIPGTRADGTIDPEQLFDWVEKVRTFARQYGRVDMGDQMIGRLLAHCPSGGDGIWPCEPVREAIENVGSQEIATGMLVGKHNSRGVVTRRDGGEQERELAEQYRTWARDVAFEHPFTANMLEQIASSFEEEARHWDNNDLVNVRSGY